MKKDARKRDTLRDYGVYKLRYNALRKNDIIPLEIQVLKKNNYLYHSIFLLYIFIANCRQRNLQLSKGC
jgi:hypothetical protein